MNILEPKYLTAAFVVAMMLLSYWQGYRTGARRTYRKIMQTLHVPEGSVISAVQFIPKRKP